MGVEAIAVVFDRYDQLQSIKQLERQLRGDERGPTFAIKGGRTVPNYRQFMRKSVYKAALAVFTSTFVECNAPDILTGDQYIILAGGYTDGQLVKQINRIHVTMLPHLFSSQEEADTRMVLHVIHMR